MRDAGGFPGEGVLGYVYQLTREDAAAVREKFEGRLAAAKGPREREFWARMIEATRVDRGKGKGKGVGDEQ